MKSKLLLTVLCVSFVVLPVSASLSIEDSSSKDYLKSNGYSSAIVESVQASKARSAGEVYVSEDQIKHANDNAFVKCVRKLFIYLDPALDDGWMDSHDIKVTPRPTDL